MRACPHETNGTGGAGAGAGAEDLISGVHIFCGTVRKLQRGSAIRPASAQVCRRLPYQSPSTANLNKKTYLFCVRTFHFTRGSTWFLFFPFTKRTQRVQSTCIKAIQLLEHKTSRTVIRDSRSCLYNVLCGPAKAQTGRPPVQFNRLLNGVCKVLRKHRVSIISRTALMLPLVVPHADCYSGGATPLVDVGDIRREAVGGRRRRRRLAPPLDCQSD
ncbi:hypothetical protein EVAR_95765_1 [Eumeta japonica]|uniref:Uncharacterized protein n=1 Tax=Eumeta variegata TaxID=151549 RepID=A0A4C1UKX7_EUMVA|nr:hypothetical protein EVAR_95765_1 [Eumeta japonica]